MSSKFRAVQVLLMLVAAAQGGLLIAAEAELAAAPPNSTAFNVHRILFLGDSITASGEYVADFDAWLTLQKLPEKPQVINAGLASETVSGLSEAGHAGGKFPRPDLFERLARVLDATKPDLAFACYGINCGIYEPFDEARFERYQAGIGRLKHDVEAAGARLFVITPPTFDDARKDLGFSYNAALDRYSQWLVEQGAAGWGVIDLHQAMNRELARRRQSDPQFSFQPDAVHPNAAGHWFMAQQLIRYFGDERSAAAPDAAAMLAAQRVPPEAMKLIRQRMNVRRDAYVAAAGHKRPGVAAGLPIAEAEAQAGELTRRIDALLAGSPAAPANK